MALPSFCPQREGHDNKSCERLVFVQTCGECEAKNVDSNGKW